MESEKGYITNGTIFIAKSNYHIQGDRIQKTGPESYTIGQAVVTTCDGALPDWKIAGRDLTVKDDGSGTAWHAVVYGRDIPFFYYPYIDFPAPGKRTTGLLMPQGGYSTRKGAFATQPFYWAIDERSDATFYLEYMSERGWKPGVEYRYFLTREAKGAVMFDYFHDDKVDNGTNNQNQDYGFKDAGGDILRTNRDRYWFRMSHDNPLPEGFLGRLELDIPSDQDYLREFKTGTWVLKTAAFISTDSSGAPSMITTTPSAPTACWCPSPGRGSASTLKRIGTMTCARARTGRKPPRSCR
jgi:LPS-assembly protein